MSTESTIHLSPSQHSEYAYAVNNLTQASAQKTSELLQRNHENHHIFFNNSGFHNHIAHHLLTLYALGAAPSSLQAAYTANAGYQRHASPAQPSAAQALHDPATFASSLGNEKNYTSFLAFFQSEMRNKGWQAVVQEYLFSGTPRADDLLVRTFAGFLHPLIHLGFGVEFGQGAVVAEALAQAAVHENWIGEVFLGAEKAAAKTGAEGKETKGEKTIVQILEECRADAKLKAAPRFEDGNKIRDGILKRAGEEMIGYASQYTVGEGEEELQRKTAEMINASAYFSAAAQRPPHQVKYDFFYIHCLNSSIFFSSFLAPHNATFLTPSTKRRLLEWKIRNDIVMYVSRGSPALHISEIENYKPRKPSGWDGIFTRVNALSDDDGHASKLIRALAHGQKACERYEGQEGFMIKGDMWEKMGHMAIDSVEAGGPNWVRSCGFEEAWREIPLREGEDARL